nr:DNA cytosine methyltransferase [Candidatus Viridilinea mediisalina]
MQSNLIMSTAKPTVIDLFAGAGGFGLGFELAGFNVPFSLEMDAWACDTLRHNHPDMLVVQQDIRDLWIIRLGLLKDLNISSGVSLVLMFLKSMELDAVMEMVLCLGLATIKTTAVFTLTNLLIQSPPHSMQILFIRFNIET